MSTAAASASTGSGCSLVVSAGNSSQDLRLDLELPAPSIDWTSCCSHKRTSEQEEFEKTASLCARFRVQGEAGFGHCVLGIESGSLLYHLSTYLPRIKTSDPVATLLCPRNADLTSSPRIASVAVEATLLFPRYADLTRSVRSRSFIHQILASNIPAAAPASPLDVHDATQDFVAHRRRSHLPLSTICRLDAVTAPVSLLDVHDTIQDLGAPPRRSHVAVSTKCRLDQQSLYHFSTSTTRFKTWEPLAVEATLLFPRYADLTSSAFITSGPAPVSLLDVHDTLQDLGAPRSRSHVAVSTTCQLDATLSSNIPTAAPASPLDVHDATQDFVAHRRRSHLPLSTICRLDAVTAPVSLLDVHDTIQDLGAPPRRSHVTVSTICRPDAVTPASPLDPIAVEATSLFPRYADLTRSQPLYHVSTSTTRFKTWEPLPVEATLLFPRYADLTRLRLHHLSTSVTRLKTSQPIAVEATSLSPRYADLTRSQPLYHFSTSTTRFKTWEPLAVEATLLFPRYADLTGYPQQPLHHLWTSATRLETSEATAVEAIWFFPRYADLTRSQPFRLLPTPATRLKTLEPIAVEATSLFARYADLTRLNSGIVFHHRPPRRLHVRRSLLAAPVPVFVAFSRKYVGSDRAAMGEMRAARALFDAGVVCALCGGGRSAGYPFGRVQEDRGREFLLGIVATVTTFLDSSKRYPTWESTLPFFPAVRVLRAAVRGLVRRRRQRYPAWESTLPFFSAVRVLRAAVRGLVRRRRHRLDNGIRLGKAPYHPSPPLEVLVAVAATVSTAVSDLGKHPAIPPRRPRAARRRGRSWSSLSPPGHHPGLGTVILVAPSPSSPLSGGVGFSSPC
ncbi:hypothetical protein B0H11DRAFT_2253270 [Mycena galericulata]|nr:hypothetical protein B0H11DRAFT_2253270 [Mycena galericulata]